MKHFKFVFWCHKKFINAEFENEQFANATDKPKHACAVQAPLSDVSTGSHQSGSPRAKSFSSDNSGDQILLRKKIENPHTLDGQKLVTSDLPCSDDEDIEHWELWEYIRSWNDDGKTEISAPELRIGSAGAAVPYC